MSAEGTSPQKVSHLKIRSTDLDAPTLVDRVAAELLNHLCVCRTCLAIFAAQQESIEAAGCVEGIRIVSRSRVKWEERRAALALSHVTEETLDDYLFGRLTREEEEALDHHAACCASCATAILHRETLIALIKFGVEGCARDQPKSKTVGAVSIRWPAHSFGVAGPLILPRRSRLVVIVNDRNPIECISPSQLRYFFLRLITHWPWGAQIIPVDLPEESQIRSDFIRKWLKADSEQLDTYWIDQMTLHGVERPLVLAGPEEVKAWIGSHPGAIGYISSSDLDDQVRAVKVI